MNQKIALILPPTTLADQYGSLEAAAPELPSLGIAFIAKFLRLKGIKVELFDFQIEPEQINDFIKNINQYMIVGMPVYITTNNIVKQFAKRLKQANQNLKIVVGGPHATLFPEDMFTENIDFIVKGDGEETFYNIVLALQKKQDDYTKIAGIYYRNKNSIFHFTFPSEKIEDINYIGAPDVADYPMEKYHPAVHLLGNKNIHTLTSRGCPYLCTFCAAAEIMGRKMRYRDVDDIIKELLKYKTMGYDSITFYDDIFTMDRERTLKLSQAMIDNNLNLKWNIFTRTNVIDEEMLALMKKAGLYLITFGAETANDVTLKMLKKGLKSDKNFKGIKMTHQSGIFAASSFMLGLPGETYDDYEKTIQWVLDSDLTFAYFPIFEPYKGTPIYEDAKKMGTWIKDDRYKNIIVQEQEEIWVPNGLEREKIEQYAKDAFRRFYLRPKIIFRILKLILQQPFERKLKFIKIGLDYFIFNKFKTSKKNDKRFA